MKPWECPRCGTINAAWSARCDCKPDPIAVEPQPVQTRRVRLIPASGTTGCTSDTIKVTS